MNKISSQKDKYKLYFDDKCPLCLKTKKIIKIFIDPINTEFIAISDSGLDTTKRSRALEDMLLESSSGSAYWGYYTYCKIFELSSKWYGFFLSLISRLMRIYIIKKLGLTIYKKISKSRKRCDDSCTI